MGKLFCKNNVGMSSENRHDLIWSLRPIFSSMRIFGIDLRYRTLGARIPVLLGVIMAVFTTSSSVVRALGWSKFDHTSTLSWLNVLIEQTVLSRNILFSLVMLKMVLLFKWRSLWETLEQMENSMSYPATFHRRLRRVSTVSITLICVFVRVILGRRGAARI